MHTEPEKNHRLAAVDALRGLACLVVVLFHYVAHIRQYSINFPYDFEYGRYRAQLFFVISEFFIFQTTKKCTAAKEFFVFAI